MKCDLQGHLKSLQTAWLLLSVCPGTADLVAHYYCSHAQRAPQASSDGRAHVNHGLGRVGQQRAHRSLFPSFPTCALGRGGGGLVMPSMTRAVCSLCFLHSSTWKPVLQALLFFPRTLGRHTRPVWSSCES